MKEPEEMTYCMTWNFPLIKDLSDLRKKRNAEKENAIDLFCKYLAADLKKSEKEKKREKVQLIRNVERKVH